MNSKAVPCSLFVPDCVTMLTCAPSRLPYVEPYVSLTTLNSRTASTPSSCPLVPPGVTLMSDAPVYSIPFSRKRLSCGRRPDTEYILPTDELDVPTPPERWVV